MINSEYTMKQSAMYCADALYTSSLYTSLMTKESTTVVHQCANSYKYMLGASSRVRGVQSYSASSKKSFNLDAMIEVIRAVAAFATSAKALAALRRTEPPRCADLIVLLEPSERRVL